MAEWSCRGLQILVRRFDSGFGLHLLRCHPRQARSAVIEDPFTIVLLDRLTLF